MKEKFIERPACTIPSDSRIAIYGAGKLGSLLKNYLEETRHRNEVQFFIDSYKSGEIDGIPIIQVDSLKRHIDKFDIIVIASQYSSEIATVLLDRGIKEFIVLDSFYFLYHEISTKAFNEYHLGLVKQRNYLPEIIVLQLSAHCNFKCKMCSHEQWDSLSGVMSDEVFFKVLQECKDNQIGELHFYGPRGEPFLHKRLTEYLKYTADSGIKSTVITNGALLDSRKIDELIDSGVNRIGISFAGYDKESYESVYVNGDFDHIVSCIGSLKEKIAAVTVSPELVVSGTIVSDEPDYFQKTIKFLKSLSLEDCEIEMKLPTNFRGAVKTGVYYPLRDIYTSLPIIDNEVVFCPYIKRWAVYIDGDVAPCGCLNYDKTYKLGNILDGGLKNFASSLCYHDIVDSFLLGNLSGNQLCEKCDFPYKVPYGFSRT